MGLLILDAARPEQKGQCCWAGARVFPSSPASLLCLNLKSKDHPLTQTSLSFQTLTIMPGRRYSTSEVNKMKAPDLKDALNATMMELKVLDETPPPSQDTQTNDALLAAVNTLTDEVRLLRESRKKDEEELKKMRMELADMYRIVAQQQTFAESLDARDRQCNLVITGVPEQGKVLDGATTEKAKYEKVLSKIGITDTDQIDASVVMSRMGTRDNVRIRPILLKMPSKATREKILTNAKKLKEAGQAYAKVYIRKDVHPATRREWKRLKDAEKSKKKKPENAASTISLDYKARVLLRDNVVIDRWKPTYFL